MQFLSTDFGITASTEVTDNKISEDMDRLISKYQKEKVKEEAI